jgi:hypothetical protein
MPNSQLFLFYSEQTYLTIHANATNWTNNTFDEFFEIPSKFSVKCSTKSVVMSPEQHNDK